MIVDAHHHLWDPARRDYPWMAGSSLAPIRRRYTLHDLRLTIGPSVTATILVQTISSMQETAEFLATAAASEGLIAGVVGWFDLTAPAELDRLLTIQGGHLLVGIRHQVEDEPDPSWLLRPEILTGLRAIAAAGLPYDLLVRAPQRPAALAVAQQLPELSFVLDHAGKPAIAAGEWDPWASWITDLAALPNVTCKLSGLTTEADWNTWSTPDIRPYTDHILNSFGPARVMFGSDWPVCELAGTYTDVLSLAQTLLPAECLADTAMRTYGLMTS